MDGWKHWLTKYTNKESTFHITLLHFTQPLILCHLVCHCYNGCVKCSNVMWNVLSKRNLPNVGMDRWMEALADKVHKQGKKSFKFYVSALFVTRAAHALAVDASSAHVHRQMANILLCPLDRKALELCRSYAQNKAQKHHPQEFPGYWWLF